MEGSVPTNPTLLLAHVNTTNSRNGSRSGKNWLDRCSCTLFVTIRKGGVCVFVFVLIVLEFNFGFRPISPGLA